MSSPQPKKIVVGTETRATFYDKTSAMLESLLMIVGVMVVILFFVWLTSEKGSYFGGTKPFREAMPLADPMDGLDDDVFEPGADELPEIAQRDIEDSLSVVAEAVSFVQAHEQSRLSGTEKGGDVSPPKTRIAEDKGVWPEYKRWKVEYSASNIVEYGQQLDFFGLEIGLVYSNLSRIERTGDFSSTPFLEVSDRSRERNSLRFEHEKRQMRRWDKTLAAKAGAKISDGLVVQFYPEETRELLRRLEAQHLLESGKELKNVARTFFKIVPEGSGFKFKVTEMSFKQ